MKRVGVILAGCGVNDGSEIHEAVLTLLALDRAGAQAVCLAPDLPQAQVWDHLAAAKSGESRNVLVESARIARGRIRRLSEVRGDELDAVVIPGGFGSVLNLSDFGSQGAACRVDAGVERLLRELLDQGKPIGALCIAPGTLARVLQGAGRSARLTIGHDAETAGILEQLGQKHVDCAAGQAVVDEQNRIVTSPAYMLARSIGEVADSAEALVREVLRLA